MKRNFKSYALIWAIFLVAFNVIVFLVRPIIPGYEIHYDLRFWIAWLFVMAAFVGNLLCANKAFQAENPADWAGEAVSATHEKVKAQTQFIKLLTVDAETLLGRAKTPDAKIAAKKVYEALRYSDPMSSEALGEIEAELAEKFRALEAAVTADQGVTEAAESLLETLTERNRKCRATK